MLPTAIGGVSLLAGSVVDEVEQAQCLRCASRSDVDVRTARVLGTQGLRIDDHHAIELQALGLLCAYDGNRCVERVVAETEIRPG